MFRKIDKTKLRTWKTMQINKQFDIFFAFWGMFESDDTLFYYK